MKVGMVIFRDSTDEVSITLVTEEQFGRIKQSFETKDNDKHVRYVEALLDQEETVAHYHQQTFCLDDTDDWSGYEVIGIHTLPEY